MPDLSRMQDDLGFIRSTVDGASATRSPSLYFLWAAISLVGFALMDFDPTRVGPYWMIAGPAGFVLSAYLGWRDQRTRGAMDRVEGMRHMQHWGSMMVVIFFVPLLAFRGVITEQAIGPLIVLILALSYFHAGLYLDPRFRWVGLLMIGGFFTVLSAAAYAWTIVGAAIAVGMTLAGILEHRRRGVAS